MLTVAEAMHHHIQRGYRTARDTMFVRTLAPILTPSPARWTYLRNLMVVRTREQWNEVAATVPEMNEIADDNLYHVMLKDARTHQYLADVITGVIPA